MKRHVFVIVAIACSSVSTLAATQPPETGQPPTLYVPDGQLVSHPIKVCVSGQIPPNAQPSLKLLRCYGVAKREIEIPLRLLGATQSAQWKEKVAGEELPRTGAMFLFGGNDVRFDMKAMLRVRPMLSWKEGDAERTLIGDPINIGNMRNTLCWAGAIVALGCAFIITLAFRSGKKPHYLLAGDDGRMSLSKTQIACWTLAVGSVVTVYGLLQLEIPDIPTSVVVLMGASLATGGLAYYEAIRKSAAANLPVPPPKATPALPDLITITTEQGPELSLSRAQMLFWTWILIILFISKSYLDGVIWEVPWPMVALMGFSQAGYLAPKLPIATTPAAAPAMSTPPAADPATPPLAPPATPAPATSTGG